MKVDQNIARAIKQYLAANNTTQKVLSKQIGVAESTMVQWFKPGRGISASKWAQLYPLIKRYLPKDRIYISSAGEEEYSSLNTAKKNVFNFPVMVPLLKPAELARYTPIISIEQFAQTENLPRAAYQPKVPGVGGIFCYELDVPSIGVPQGAKLFASSEAKPTNNSIVLATTLSGEIILGVFHTSGNEFELDAGDRRITGNLVEVWRKFASLFPVVCYEVICY